MKKEKKAVFAMLVVIALVGTYINYKPSINKVNIESVEITEVQPSPSISKVFKNKDDMKEFSKKFYDNLENFKPMVLNLDKDFDSIIYLEREDGTTIPAMIQDDCIKIDKKWYKTDNEFIEYTKQFFDSKQGVKTEESQGMKYYDIQQ